MIKTTNIKTGDLSKLKVNTSAFSITDVSATEHFVHWSFHPVGVQKKGVWSCCSMLKHVSPRKHCVQFDYSLN